MFEGIGNVIHLIAAVLWVGGLGLMVLVVGPVARKVLDEPRRLEFLAAAHRMVIPLSLAGLGILVASGTMLLTEDPHFEGWGAYGSTWSRIMVAKHALLVVMGIFTIAVWRNRKSATRKELLDICFYLGLGILVLTGFLTALE